jgi:carbonic anhydrase/acetyltransferase-like protein (isoleucine patch superfamily)
VEALGLDTTEGEGLAVGILEHHGVTPTIDPSAFIAPGSWVIGDVVIEADASIWFNAVLRGDINGIRIGKRSNIQDGVVVHVTKELDVVVGDDVTVGHKAMLHGCRVDQGSLIGMNAVVLDRARVGAFAVVAAGSVVREGFVVPEGMLVAGVRAKVIRAVTEGERRLLLQSASNYVEYARSFRRQ